MAAKFKQPSAAVLAARARRQQQGAARTSRIEWFIDEVSDKIEMTLEQRVRLATQLVKDKVIRNISRPVTKGTGPRGGRVVTDRSVPGEFPKADTTQLMKTIFDDYRESPNGFTGYVGTPLDYGLILEIKRDRSFLKRTLEEEMSTVKRILTGPIK